MGLAMNFNTVNVTMLGIGALLIYAALKDQSIKEVMSNAFTQSNTTNPTTGGRVGTSNSGWPGSTSTGTSSPGNGTRTHSTATHSAIVTSV